MMTRELIGKEEANVILARRPLPMQAADNPPRSRTAQMTVNYFNIRKLPDCVVVHYDVTIEPEIIPAFIRKVFAQFEVQHRNTPQMGGHYVAFDGRKNLYSKGDLPFGDSHTFEVREPKDADFREAVRQQRGQGPQNGPSTYRMTLKKVSEIPLDNIEPFIAGERHGQQPHEPIMALDIILRHKASLIHTTVGRNFFTPEEAWSLGGGAVVHAGFHQALRPVEKSLKINVDVTASAFYENGPLIGIVAKILFPNDTSITPRSHNRQIDSRNRERLAKTLKGLRIKTSYRGEEKRFKINTVAPETAITSTFEKNGRQYTVFEYFQEEYNITLNYPEWPLIVVGDRNKGSIPLEVCEALSNQRLTRKLNERQTSEMIKFTCKPPDQRLTRILNSTGLLEYKNNEYFNHFGIEVDTDHLFVTQARIFQPPTLLFGNNREERPTPSGWRMQDKTFYQPTILKSWVVLVFSNMSEQVVRQFIMELISTLEVMGLKVENRNPKIGLANPNQIEQEMQRAWTAAGNQVQFRPQLLVCVLPNSGVPLYAEIKRVSDTIIGTPSQCLQAKHVERKARPYCQNVALKINVKLGGTNFIVKPQEFGWVMSEPTIIIGADITDPSPEDLKRGQPTIIALIGSIDWKLGKYSSQLAAVPQEQTSKKLKDMIVDLLKAFYKESGGKVKPTRVIYYRDGVSEGQFGPCLQKETKAIRDACATLDKGYNMKITYIVVQKRHHTRIFPGEPRDQDKSGNALPGTVIDHDIVHPTDFEFYLQSHAGLQGTSRPGRYTVLYDENNVTAERIQNVTNQLANVFARANKPVSTSTPAYYANLLAARAKFFSKTAFLDSESVASGGGMQHEPYGVVKSSMSDVMWFM